MVIDDMEFCVDRIIKLPKIRPHQIEKAVRLSIDYSKIVDFREKLLEKSNECPVLIYQLHKRGVLTFQEVDPFLRYDNAFWLCYYFRKEIKSFESFIERKFKPGDFDESFLQNENNIDQMIEYGFLPSTIEYSLKYDGIDDFIIFDNYNQKAKWSPFEWSYEPTYLDLLSFSGFFGSIKCFKHLLLKGFQISENVLSMVVCSGCIDLFHLCQGQQFITSDSLFKASEFSHISLLVFLIENGGQINTKDKTNQTPLHYVSRYGHLSVVEYLVNQKVDINTKDDRNFTPLHLASQYGHLSVVEYLVNQKADINAKDNIDWTPLHLAARDNHLSVVKYLVYQKADINAKDYNDWTPLHFAAQYGYLSVVEYLVDQKADINAKDYNDWTPLHFAAQYGHLSVVEYLVDQKADINAKDNNWTTPLRLASEIEDYDSEDTKKNKSRVVEFLKRKGGILSKQEEEEYYEEEEYCEEEISSLEIDIFEEDN